MELRVTPQAAATPHTQDQRDEQPASALMATILAAVKASGADAGTVTAAQLLLARGVVAGIALETTAILDEGLHTALACYDDIAHRVARHQPLRPLIAAAEHVKAEAVAR